jgi:hypothetical protein
MALRSANWRCESCSRSELGKEPRVSVAEIADRYIDWARQHPDARDHSLEAERVMKAAGAIRVAS